MLGRFQIGSQWLGSGRSRRQDYVTVAGALSAGATFVPGQVDAAKAIGMAAAGVATMAGEIRKVRPVSGAMAGTATATFAFSSIRTLSAGFVGQVAFTGSVRLRRQLGAAMDGIAALGAAPTRQRRLGASLEGQATLAGPVRRAIKIAGAMAAEAQTSLAVLRAATVGAGLGGVATMTVPKLFNQFAPPQAGRIIPVEPKDREIPVEPKERVIIFTGDDEGLSMEERIKQPSEVVDYALDMRDWFKSIFEDEITDVAISIDITGDPDDLEVGPDAQPDWTPVGSPAHMAKIWLGGGRDGTTYQVTAVVTTTEGRVEEIDFLVIVEEQ